MRHIGLFAMVLVLIAAVPGTALAGGVAGGVL
jgi:hypothetical protein